MDLESPVQFVKGVGPQRAEGLAKLGVNTAEDLLLHVPMRYEDRRQFARVADLRIGMKVAVSGKVAVAGLRRARRLSIYELRLDDGSGRLLKAIFFNQPFLKDVLAVGKRVVLFGLVERDAMASRLLVMRSPQYEIVEQDEHGGIHTGRLVPVYEKLGALTVKPLRRVLAQLAAAVPADLADPLPPELRERLSVIGRAEALRRVHLPGDDDTPRRAQPLPLARPRAADPRGAAAVPARPGAAPQRRARRAQAAGVRGHATPRARPSSASCRSRSRARSGACCARSRRTCARRTR